MKTFLLYAEGVWILEIKSPLSLCVKWPRVMLLQLTKNLLAMFLQELSFSSRFLLDLNIAAPKVTIPTDFSPDNTHSTKLLLDFGNLVIHTKVIICF